MSSLTFQSLSLALVVAPLPHWSMEDSLPITNNPLLPFFPTVRKESPKSSALIAGATHTEIVNSNLQHAQDSLSNTNDAEPMTSLEKW